MPSAHDWEARRSQITELYYDNDRPLKEVMSVVNGPGGFRATAKMYKARITKWGLDKKIKEHEARVILQMHAQRRGKPTKIMLRGRPVNINKIEHYFRRKGICVDDVLGSCTKTTSDADLFCRTPSPRATPLMRPTSFAYQGSASINAVLQEDPCLDAHMVGLEPDPWSIASPDSFRTAEFLFADIREYVLCSFGTGLWLSTNPEELCHEKNYARSNGAAARALFINLRSAISLLDAGVSLDARQRLSSGFSYVKDFIEAQLTDALPYFAVLLAALAVRGYSNIAVALCHRICAMTGAMAKDPGLILFKRIFSNLGWMVSDGGGCEFLLALMQSLIHPFEQVLGAVHMQTLHTCRSLTAVMKTFYGAHAVEGPMLGLCRSLEEHQGLYAMPSIETLLDLARIQMECKHFQAAVSTSQTVVERATLVAQTSPNPAATLLVCEGYELAAESHECNGDSVKAVSDYQKSLDICQWTWGPHHWIVAKFRARLCQFLSWQKRKQEAAELVAQGLENLDLQHDECADPRCTYYQFD